MVDEDFHPTDQELLLAADGELSSRRTAELHAHLSSCWPCRARMAEVEQTVLDFVRVHRQSLDPQLPPLAGPRALLRARLAELAPQQATNVWTHFFHVYFARHSAAYLSLALLIGTVLLAMVVRHSPFSPTSLSAANLASAFSERGIVPDRRFTPGATREVAIRDVCSMAHEEVVVDVPAAVRREILEEYGIADGRAADYEIDYLIAPGLGGSEDIHNLWPEPYTTPTWNARVKDNLEEHLHELVCSGRVNLSTAQRDIATDWVAAYKKYFNTDKPLSSDSNSSVAISDSRCFEKSSFLRQCEREMSIIELAF